MDVNKSKSLSKENLSDLISTDFSSSDEIAKLKRVSDIDNFIERTFGDLIIKTVDKTHVKELAELWANLASLQQLYDSARYNFHSERKDWQVFVENKISKKNNLLLVAHKANNSEIMGFLYLQTIALPSSDIVFKGVLEDIYTKPQFRRQNVASNLIEVGLEWLQNQGIKQISLISLNNTKQLKLFYGNVFKKLNEEMSIELVTI